MAFYFYFGPTSSYPLYMAQSQPYYQSLPHFENYPSVENRHNISTNMPLPQSEALLSLQNLPTRLPESNPHISSEGTKNRRKRQKNMDRQLISAKKNSESNIINHFFTYFISKEFSEKVVRRAIKSIGNKQNQVDKKVIIFYNVVRLLNMKRGRKYINKAMLLSFFTENWLSQSIDNIENLEELSVRDIALILRKCFYIFVGEISLVSILTSKRITKHSKEIHLAKRRKILSYMEQNQVKIDRY